ncbi:interferon-induced GTP-binding protein Mx3-like isoform X2 [Misgurnus anguillicaudatus]|uniref:interferon-induced GTP-binding protein Mx3-like isoform X2 n=1 Tax=Misgurnus anguillicaudatus TaxID=75329 RepID=UPI003CCF75DC
MMTFFTRSSGDSLNRHSSFNERRMGGELHNRLEENIRPLIDLIDKLRSLEIQGDLDMSLPTIVVIGDQSSGKSSVLEALSGVALPRGSGMVTRCPLELKLRKVTGGSSWKAIISYRKKNFDVANSSVGNTASSGARQDVRVSYTPQTITFEDPFLVERHVKEAQIALAGDGAGISDEIITLEIRSPDVCDLTLIDLPGIARVPLQGQPLDIGNKIKALIMKFIVKSETINMVVVPLNIDIATTEALKMAQEVDPDGTRTFAVLTKPDLIDRGTERHTLAIAQNKVVPLRKGYIMVKCRGQQQIDDDISLDEASTMEKDFFENHDYFSCLLNENKATIPCLANELTKQLVSHIKKSLPLLDEEIKKQLSEVRKDMKEFEGGPPRDPQGAKQYLINILSEFNQKMQSLSLGDLIMKENMFNELRVEYKKWNDFLNNSMSTFFHPTSRIRQEIIKNRGRELASFSSYRVFEMLLQKHVAQLKDPAIALLNTVKDITFKQLSCLSKDCFWRYPELLKLTMEKIDKIQSSQLRKAEERITEQFKMENMICTQDDIYFKTLNRNMKEAFSDTQLPFCDIASKYSDMLKAYYEIMVQRMADQVPMLTRYCMLKEGVQLLCNDMLTLLDSENVGEILSEDTDIGQKRRDLQARLDRLNTAQEEIDKCT